MLTAVRYIFYAECLIRMRRPQEWCYPIAFFLVTILLLPLAFTTDVSFLKQFLPGYIWITALFSCLLSLEQVFLSDSYEDFTSQWFLAEIPLPILITIKLLVHWLVTGIPIVLFALLLCVLFQLPSLTTFSLSLSLLLGTIILTWVGSLGAALTMGLRQQSTLLGFLILPLTIPILVFGISIPVQANAHLSVSGPFALLAALLLIVIVFLPLAIAGTLRITLSD